MNRLIIPDYFNWICRIGDLESVRCEVEHNKDVIKNNQFAIKLAAEYGHLEIVKLLVENGADIRVNGDICLKWAEYNGHTDVVEFLKSKL